jgi:restriction endonuclease S subunit
VASTSFFVIRLRDKTILPAYLAWYLNSNKAQQELKAQAIGTGIPSISKQVLEMLELNVPTLEKQEAVLKISTLFEREKRIRIEIELLREHQIQQYIINAIK